MFEQFTNDSGRSRMRFAYIAAGALAGVWLAVIGLFVFTVTHGGFLVIFFPLLAVPAAAVGAVIGAIFGRFYSLRADPG